MNYKQALCALNKHKGRWSVQPAYTEITSNWLTESGHCRGILILICHKCEWLTFVGPDFFLITARKKPPVFFGISPYVKNQIQSMGYEL